MIPCGVCWGGGRKSFIKNSWVTFLEKLRITKYFYGKYVVIYKHLLIYVCRCCKGSGKAPKDGIFYKILEKCLFFSIFAILLIVMKIGDFYYDHRT